jgi:hypothetical protein
VATGTWGLLEKRSSRPISNRSNSTASSRASIVRRGSTTRRIASCSDSTGSKRPKRFSLTIPTDSQATKTPQQRSHRASIVADVATTEAARHAGRRGVGARRSRSGSPLQAWGFASVRHGRHVEDVPRKCPRRSGVRAPTQARDSPRTCGKAIRPRWKLSPRPLILIRAGCSGSVLPVHDCD